MRTPKSQICPRIVAWVAFAGAARISRSVEIVPRMLGRFTLTATAMPSASMLRERGPARPLPSAAGHGVAETSAGARLGSRVITCRMASRGAGDTVSCNLLSSTM